MTDFPYKLYRESNRASNMAYAGVGLGLIHAQKLFWISSLGLSFLVYKKNEWPLFYILCFIGISFSLYKSYQLSRYLRYLL